MYCVYIYIFGRNLSRDVRKMPYMVHIKWGKESYIIIVNEDIYVYIKRVCTLIFYHLSINFMLMKLIVSINLIFSTFFLSH